MNTIADCPVHGSDESPLQNKIGTLYKSTIAYCPVHGSAE